MDAQDQEAIIAGWRVEEAAERRRHATRERELLAAELALDQLWHTWAANEATVVVHTTAGRDHHGRVVGVGADLVMLQPVAGNPVAIAMATVAAVSTSTLSLSGAEVRPSATTMAELARELGDQRAEARVVAASGLTVRGRIEAVGVDAVVVRDPADRRTYLRLEALSELSSMSMTSSSW
jgi:hypothetical protein